MALNRYKVYICACVIGDLGLGLDTGEDEGSSSAEKAEERSGFVSAERRRHCGFSRGETVFGSRQNLTENYVQNCVFFSVPFYLAPDPQSHFPCSFSPTVIPLYYFGSLEFEFFQFGP